jgi:hypothetical protein
VFQGGTLIIWVFLKDREDLSLLKFRFSRGSSSWYNFILRWKYDGHVLKVQPTVLSTGFYPENVANEDSTWVNKYRDKFCIDLGLNSLKLCWLLYIENDILIKQPVSEVLGTSASKNLILETLEVQV